jgi:hypothetical protein
VLRFFLYGLFFFFDFDGFGIDLGRSLGTGLFPDLVLMAPFFGEFPLFVSVLEDFSFFPFLVFDKAPLVDIYMAFIEYLRPGFDFYSFL